MKSEGKCRNSTCLRFKQKANVDISACPPSLPLHARFVLFACHPLHFTLQKQTNLQILHSWYSTAHKSNPFQCMRQLCTISTWQFSFHCFPYHSTEFSFHRVSFHSVVFKGKDKHSVPLQEVVTAKWESICLAYRRSQVLSCHLQVKK